MKNKRELGIVVYGATGYTGRLVAEYLNNQYGVGGEVKWGMAGRSLEKLTSVRDEMGIASDVPLVVADADEHASIKDMVERCAVVITTVGPYQLYGSGLVADCAAAGTDYVDLCGEPTWMHEMIAENEKAAKQSGARIVFSCGFDSIPFDLGVFFLQETATKKFGSPIARVKGRVRSMKGTWSGGTLASFRASMAAVARKPELLAVLKNPFALTPGFTGVDQPKGNKPEFDKGLDSWAAPFVMASINTKNIHRSNFLLDHQYGEDFAYDEMILTGPGEKGETVANAIAADKSMASDPTKPGEGPSKEEREAGSYDVLFVGQKDSGESVQVSVQGDMDPGYGSTSKMIAESAVCLLMHPDLASGGIWTPASAMGSELLGRLQKNAGLTFKVE
ncbi:MAG: saccharopine dehydrogenase NADP-binding domain-containing protein [Woeseia sp.]|nr:saccharopine dehydrogenase NADP-binding domain-containing protein [Woeseia sp.]MBT8097642.1 saccharopine dehydrogenase NADP-binding domain-containing protein [Woeseia sp.]NNF66854.1 saccharopine dehydrogenase [Gammaproteobacteria bacterium]